MTGGVGGRGQQPRFGRVSVPAAPSSPSPSRDSWSPGSGSRPLERQRLMQAELSWCLGVGTDPTASPATAPVSCLDCVTLLLMEAAPALRAGDTLSFVQHIPWACPSRSLAEGATRRGCWPGVWVSSPPGPSSTMHRRDWPPAPAARSGGVRVLCCSAGCWASRVEGGTALRLHARLSETAAPETWAA